MIVVKKCCEVFLENFLRRSCFCQTLVVSTLFLIHLDKSSCKRNDLHPSLTSGRKKILSDFSSFLIFCMVRGVFLVSLVLMLGLFDCLFLCFCFVLSFFNKKMKKIRKIQKQCVFMSTGTCVPQIAFETKFPNFVSLVAQMSTFMHN